MNNEDKFKSFHNNIMGCVHYNEAIEYIVNRWDKYHKRQLIKTLIDCIDVSDVNEDD